MLDFAKLGIAVDSRSTKTASQDMDRMVKTGEKAERQFKDTGKASETAGRKVHGYAKATDRAEKETREWAGAARRAEANVRGLGRASAVASAGIGGMVRNLLGTVAAFVGIRASIQTLANFEQGMSRLSAISRATTGELEQMRDVAERLGSTTEFTATQAAEGMQFLAMAGFSARESIEAIPATLDLATAASMGLGRAADITSNIMSAFQIPATQAGDAADVLAGVSSRANTNVQELGTAMAFVGPIANAMGISINDTAAAIGKLSDAGLKGSMAGTGLRRILSSVANATPEATAAIEQMGIKLEDLDPTTNSIVEIIQEFSDANITAAEALTIFGDRGGPAILALTGMSEELRRLTEDMADVRGEAKRMADEMRDNLRGDLNAARSAAEGLIIALGAAGLTNALRTAVQSVVSVLRGLTSMVKGTIEAEGAVYVLVTAVNELVQGMSLIATVVGTAVGAVYELGEIIYETGKTVADFLGVTDLLDGALKLLGETMALLVTARLVAMVAGFSGLGGVLTATRNAVLGINGVLVVTSGLLSGGITGAITRAMVATRAMNALAVASKVASGAIALMGGPAAVLAGALTIIVTKLVQHQRAMDAQKLPAENAAEAIEMVNKALDTFSRDRSPQAAQAAIDTAQRYRDISAAALTAAEAQLEELRIARNVANAQSEMKHAKSLFAEEEAAMFEEEYLLQLGRVAELRGQDELAAARLLAAQEYILGATMETETATGKVKDETEGVGDEADRVLKILGQVPGSLDNASAAAILLASQMGVSADEAERMLLALDAAAGIKSVEDPKPRLGFGSSVGSTGETTQFTLGFGDLTPEGVENSRLKEYWESRNKATRTARRGGAGSGVDEIEQLNTAYQNLLGTLSPVYAATQQFLGNMKELGAAQAANAITAEEYTQAVDLLIAGITGEQDAATLTALAEEELNKAVERGIITKEQAADAAKRLAEAYEDVNSQGQKLTDDLSSAFAAIVTGAQSATQALANLASQWASTFLQKGFSQFLDSFGFGDIVDEALSGLGWDTLASGTTFARGGPTLVGEEGMEIAVLPDGRAAALGVRGPQLVDIPRGTEVYPNNVSMEMLRATDIGATDIVPDLAQTVDAGGQASAASGTVAQGTLSGRSPRLATIEPSRVEPMRAQSTARNTEPGLRKTSMVSEPSSNPEVKVEPILEVHNHNYFDRDKFVGGYLDSQQGRIKVANNVAEEQAGR